MKVKRSIKWVMVLLLIPLVLISCDKKAPDIGDTITIYFADIAKGNLFAESVAVDPKVVSGNIEKIQFVISALRKGAQSNAIQANMVMPIKEVNLNDRLAYVLFEDNYTSLSLQEKMSIRASLVYSLTELSFIDNVEFFVDDRPIVNSNGALIGPISRNDIVLSVLSPNPPTTIQTVALYFAGKDHKKLIKEQRELQVNSSMPLEKYIIDELIKGPNLEGLEATIPKETIVNDVNTKEGVCQVDLSFDLKSKQFTLPESKTFMIYSIVNSLTELPEIQKVAFLIDGKKEIEFSKDIDLSEFFERKEALIE